MHKNRLLLRHRLALCITLMGHITSNYLYGVESTPGKTFFFTYLWNQFTHTAPYTNPNPIEQWPTVFPEASELAKTLKENLCFINSDQFLFGASTSEHQCSKQCTQHNCSWTRFATDTKRIADGKALPQPTDISFEDDINGFQSGYLCNFWDDYKEYIDYLKETFNLNALRFSVEWGLVQPDGSHSYDQKALNHYADLFVYLIKKGITPVVCMHHYTDPCWFDDTVGNTATNGTLLKGFESVHNIQHFKNFCTTVYETLIKALDKALSNGTIDKETFKKSPQPLWATFNSPEGFVFKGYRQMGGPPSDPKKQGLDWVTLVLENVLDAHVKTYHSIHTTYKELSLALLANKDVIKEPQVGLLKNMLPLDCSHKNWIHSIVSPLSWICSKAGDMIQNDSIFTFFTDGIYQVQIPFGPCVQKKHDDAHGALDFIGINYYSNKYLCGPKEVIETNEQHKTDNGNYRIYPQGLYRVIQEIDAKLVKPFFNSKGKNLPIYITENGIATTDDNKRNHFYQQYLTALNYAIEKGYDVRGYLTWTAFDNYEWPKITYDQKLDAFIPHRVDRRFYGLCTVLPHDYEPNKTQLQIKEGAQYYQQLTTLFFDTIIPSDIVA